MFRLAFVAVVALSVHVILSASQQLHTAHAARAAVRHSSKYADVWYQGQSQASVLLQTQVQARAAASRSTPEQVQLQKDHPLHSASADQAADSVSRITEGASTAFVVCSCILGALFAAYQYHKVRQVEIVVGSDHPSQATDALLKNDEKELAIVDIHGAIEQGAKSFLWAEYKICFMFIIVFGTIVFLLVGSSADSWWQGAFSFVAFAVGGTTSILSGYIGMLVAVYANVRTTISAQKGYGPAFDIAFRAGAVMGFALCSLALAMLYLLLTTFFLHFEANTVSLMEAIASYGLGGSSIALFGRVGGGIYTKAADVGADLVGKVEAGIPEDDPRNPAVIADNVGDNVGDVAGMGADLFGSFAEASCAALVIASHSPELSSNWNSLCFPLLISALGIVVCLLTSFYATWVYPVKEEKEVETALKMQLIISTVLMTPLLYYIAWLFLPVDFTINDLPCHQWGAFVCIAVGLWAGLITGLVTEYYTSHSYKPVREVADSCQTGAATNIIYGLALGYKSVIIPVLALATAIFFAFYMCHMYGIALAALGMLSSLSTGLTIDAYGPICDNAGGIAEMAQLGEEVRDITDALDAAGNTTAAIGKGFAIGSAALVSLALFGAFVTRLQISGGAVNILQPMVFSGLLIGAMLPYWFSAMTLKSVGIAAQAMVAEVRHQFKTIEGLMEGKAKPDYHRCVEISTNASLREMIAPGALVMLTPIITGYFFGIHAVCGLLAGGLVSGVQMAISASNTGGAWDNAKKYIEQGNFGGKGGDPHKAAVVGDTVGDPLKDTSGPSLNILMKLMAIISLVFADFFHEHSLARGCTWAGYPPVKGLCGN